MRLFDRSVELSTSVIGPSRTKCPMRLNVRFAGQGGRTAEVGGAPLNTFSRFH
jgi:hypothetical protein